MMLEQFIYWIGWAVRVAIICTLYSMYLNKKKGEHLKAVCDGIFILIGLNLLK